MKTARLIVNPFFLVACLASVATAQVQRTFVSGLGNDSNPCSRTAPCRTFGQAISHTSPGGEVIVLDSAGYGPVTITQGVSLIAPPGVTAGISVFSGDGIDINAGASDTIILRGLTVNNQGSFGNGIVFNMGGTLHIENCVVNGFSSGFSAGVLFQRAGTLEVKDSIMRGNFYGIKVTGSGFEPGTALATIEQVRLEASVSIGLLVEAGGGVIIVTVRNSLASNNKDAGFFAYANGSGPVELNIENCVASNNSAGVFARSDSTGVATIRVSNSTVTDNQTGLVNVGSPAVILSRGNNTVEGNTNDTSGTIGSYTAK